MRIHIRLDLPVGMIAYDDAGGKGGWARVVVDAFERACLWKIITEGKIVVEICLRL